LAEKLKERVKFILSSKTRKFEKHLHQQFSSIFGLDPAPIKSNFQHEKVLNYGTIGA
jgi:hypothetical protein